MSMSKTKTESYYDDYCDCDDKNICPKCGKKRRPKYRPKITC